MIYTYRDEFRKAVADAISQVQVQIDAFRIAPDVGKEKIALLHELLAVHDFEAGLGRLEAVFNGYETS